MGTHLAVQENRLTVPAGLCTILGMRQRCLRSFAFKTMTSYSILCTNPRHGGQCELLVDAASPEQAQQHVADSRPHYIIETIEPVERKFVCHGFCRKHERYDALSYIVFSAEQARSICEQLNPHFVIDCIEEIGEV
jgi:DNA-dependent RNA polymerase auxiliary subunit epsilon